MNTYGLFSINQSSFNVKWHGRFVYPKELRDVLVTVLRLHNFTLNVLGYIEKTSMYSGCFRMLTGLSICVLTLKYGDPKAKKGAIIGDWYSEALITGITQIARGALEAFVPYGKYANAALDAICTIVNLYSMVEPGIHVSVSCMACEEIGTPIKPHENPDNLLSLLLCFA